ncbi:hypothetical protein [Polaromonas sp. UC242_47]|uniref:hypothetical protein n=1 Tax=Polaromonas sp. UC242_47 TaxID=3374626 RepID=UPI003791F87A
MGIASFSRSSRLSALFAPLQALAAFWVPTPPAAASSPVFAPVPTLRRCASGHTPSAIKNIANGAHPSSATGQKPCQTVAKTTSPRRLKIVRALEAGIHPACAGRMVISGRMADVCAELDRMAQREAAAQAA